MILVIRISGLVEVPNRINEALFRMRLRRKYTAILLKPSNENMKLLENVRNFVAYGDIDPETLYLLIEKRAQLIDKKKKINTKEIIDNMAKKSLESIGIKSFFRLHPPRGGIDSKIHFPIRKGVLGDNKGKINVLVRRML